MGILRRIRLRRAGLGAALGTAALIVLAAGPGAANASPSAAPSSPAGASLNSISCPMASWCMAVGSYTTTSGVQHALAQVWNGTTWQLLKPDGTSLASVSCTATWFCLATGGPTRAERWNGTAWREVAGPQGAVSQLSCSSRSWCMVINGSITHPPETFAESWNGSKWRTWWEDTDICTQGDAPGYPCGLGAVSCGSASNCVAAGNYSAYLGVDDPPSNVPGGYTWNGKTWTLALQNPGPDFEALESMIDVSCRGKFCLAIGGDWITETGFALTWNPVTSTWTKVADAPTYGADSISCASSTSCAVLTHGIGEFWNGTTWTQAATVREGPSSRLGALSCHAGTCVAVGFDNRQGVQQTIAEIWNGTKWTVSALPQPALGG